MGLSREEVLHVAVLARVGLSGEEIEKLTQQLSNIVEHFQVLRQLDTSEVPPTTHPTAVHNVSREDVVRDSLPQELVLANAPLKEEDHFKIKAVLE